MPHELEAPGTDATPEWSSLYRARGPEVTAHRPVFTGDVFINVAVDGEDEPKTVMILQHPCAIRIDGVTLAPKLLVAEVLQSNVMRPSRWSTGYYKMLPLVDLRPSEPNGNYAAFFNKHHLVTPVSLEVGERIACLAQRGVNLLLQRWVHHNSRVVVPTSMYQEVSSPQFEEADMIEEWCIDREDDGIKILEATREIDTWFSTRNTAGVSPRDRIKDEQERSGLRREARNYLRLLKSNS